MHLFLYALAGIIGLGLLGGIAEATEDYARNHSKEQLDNYLSTMREQQMNSFRELMVQKEKLSPVVREAIEKILKKHNLH